MELTYDAYNIDTLKGGHPLLYHFANSGAVTIFAQAHTGTLGRISRNRAGTAQVTANCNSMAKVFSLLESE